MVLAAGLGTRLRPITEAVPKPLVEVGGRTLIDHAIDRLVAVGVSSVVVNLHYKAAMIADRLAARAEPRIAVSEEATLLETGAAASPAPCRSLDDAFFVVNSDVFWLDGKDCAAAPGPGLRPRLEDAVLLLQRTVRRSAMRATATICSIPRGDRAGAASERSPHISSPASSCCTAASSTASPTASSR